MCKKQIIGLASVALALAAGALAQAQSAYFQAVTNLNPVVYFPLQETNPPPVADVETNYGSLGRDADAVYSGHNVSKGAGGATADGDTAVSLNDAYGAFLAVPTTDPGTGVQVPAFTVEAWVNSAESGRNFEGIVSKAGGNTGGILGANNLAGWCLSQNYIAYLDSSILRGFDFHVYNGVGHEGAEVVVAFPVTNNVWYHLVATFDGTNCRFYINGMDMVAAGYAVQIPMAGSYVPDTWNQLCIGTSRGLNANNYHGLIDEVAIYTNVLSSTQIQAHYQAAGGSSYASTVLTDNPYMYWRMDSPGYTAPAASAFPVATNYGFANATFFGNYGPATQPGVAGPAYAGLLDPNNGNASYGVAINGISGNNGDTATTPVGYDASQNALFAPDAGPVVLSLDSPADPASVLLNPTNHTPFSFTIWFKANPDDYNRLETMVGHSDAGWRLAMGGNNSNIGHLQFNPGNNGDLVSTYFYEDANWHQAVCVYNGSNNLMYVDGVLDSTGAATAVNVGSLLYPMLGSDPFYLDGGNAYSAGRGGTANTTYYQRDFSGRLAHFAFFTNVLTAAQAQYLYTNAVPTQAPYILSQPATGRVNPAPGYLYFGVVGRGTGPLAYQWYFNPTASYSGATALVSDNVKYTLTTTLQMTVSNLVATDSGYYFVVITNNYGSVTSSLASLAVNYLPVITAQSPTAAFNLFSSQRATMSVTAVSETNALFYQWYVNGAADPGGTNALYLSAPVTASGTTFYCIVTNVYGAVTNLPLTATLLPWPAYLTNSPLSSNILALNPTTYWPMHETGETPATGYVETNYGALGNVANGFYGCWQNSEQAALGAPIGGNENAPTNISVVPITGAIAGSPDKAMNMFAANNSFIVVPRTATNSTIKPPFTLEAWLRPMDSQTFGVAVGEDSGTFNSATNNRGGFDWLYAGSANCFSMTVYNGNGGGSTEPKTSASYPPGPWYHVVTTFDGTNVQYYINGVADAMQSTAATMNPNTWDPITIGCGRGYNNNLWRGSMDEVAIYTNILSVGDIQKHYNDGTNAAYANYTSDVLADKPLVYYRMDAPAYAPAPISTWPVLTNYGTVALNGVYHPGAVPAGAAGPSEDGLPVAGLAANTALAGNGTSAFADAGFIPQFSPTGKTPFSVAAWMKGNPADSSRGWQTIVGHSDAAWRLVLDGNGTTNGAGHGSFNAGPGGGSDIGNGPDYSVSTINGGNPPITINDGNWHYVVGTFDGSNSIIYVDGLVGASGFNASANLTSGNEDVFLGAYPNNTVYSNMQRSASQEIGRALAGSICEAAFWNGVALKTNQVQQLYNSMQVAPIIDRQPVSAAVNQNTAFTNTVYAGGTTLAYQWYENNVARLGQTNASLIIPSVQVSDASANWYAIVTNSYASVTSAVVSLTVFSVPTITLQPPVTNLTLYAGGHDTFSVAALGAVPLHYQWYSNLVGIASATNTSYALTNAQPPNSTNNYYCIVTNSAGRATNLAVAVTVLPIPTTIPYSKTILADNPLGYWPLNEKPDNGEGNGGAVANDVWAGNNGVYTNVNLDQDGFNPTIDTNGTSVEFGLDDNGINNMVYGIPTNVDFSSSGNSSFSVEAWVKGYSEQLSDEGVISKGYGGGGEQFSLDTGSDGATAAGGVPNPTSHSYRWLLRTASGTAYTVLSAVNPGDSLWHYLAGVCSESSTNSVMTLYVDGLSVGSTTFGGNAGIQTSARNMLIGTRPSNGTTNVNDDQFIGYIQDVAVYSYALTAAQALLHYEAGDIPASVLSINPTNVVAGQYGTATVSAVVLGTPPISYQWYDVNNSGQAIPGQTNSTLVLSNILYSSQNGDSYYLQVANAFGTNTGPWANLTVYAGAPQIVTDVPSQIVAVDGSPVAISVTAYGDEPLTYQWQFMATNEVTWSNLTDDGRIIGSASNVLTIAGAKLADSGSYQVVVSNGSGSTTSGTALMTVAALPISFYGSGLGWSPHGSATITTNLLTLTDPNGLGGNATFFFDFPQYIGGFKAAFTYQAGGNKAADGIAFVLQNDPRGAGATGGSGGSLGVSGITPSFELEYNIYTGTTDGVGYNTFINGNNGTNIAPGKVSLGSGDPIVCDLFYTQGILSLTLTDAVANTSYSTNINVGDLTKVVGGASAYVGFTGSFGAATAVQTITDFSFESVLSESIQLQGTNVVIAWPTVTGYTVQETGDLTAGNWINVTNQPGVVNGLNQVTLPVTGANTFYRLVIQP